VVTTTDKKNVIAKSSDEVTTFDLIPVAQPIEWLVPKDVYKSRPKEPLHGITSKAMTGCGEMYVTINRDPNNKIFEVFFKLGKVGSCVSAYLDALGVAISIGLRCGAPVEKYIEKFRGIRCSRPFMRNGEFPTTLSCPDAISQALANALQIAVYKSTNETQELSLSEPQGSSQGVCPECSGMLVHVSGCEKCLDCSYSGRCT
jgi:ribonucleoside-diphosphate reductase alpha chain